MIAAPRNRSTASLWRTAAVSFLCVVVTTCGDSTSTAPTQPTPPPGRWLGAERIDGEPPDFPSCNPPLAPVVAADASGGIVASWLSGCRVWVSTTSRGQAWGRPGQLATIAANVPPSWIWEPTLAANSAGVALVAWAAEDRTAGRQLFSSRYRPPAWFVVQRFDGGEAQQLASPYAAALALDGAGSGLAVWDSGGVVAARRLASLTSDAWQAPGRLAPQPSSAPRVFLDAAGRGFATWSSSGEAFAQRFEPEGGWGETTRFAPDAGWSFVGSGEVAFDGSGQALLVWQRNQGSTQVSSVWSAAYTAGRWSALGPISASGGRAVSPHVGIDSSGRGISVWSDPFGPVHARYESGAWTAPLVVASAAGMGPTALAVSAGGHAIVAWKETDAATGRSRVAAARYAGGAWGARESLQASSNQPNHPAAAIDPCGNAVAIWSELESGRTRVWANRYETACP